MSIDFLFIILCTAVSFFFATHFLDLTYFNCYILKKKVIPKLKYHFLICCAETNYL